LVLGWVLDRGTPNIVFYIIASMLMLTVLTVFRVRRFASQPGYTA